MIRPNLTARRAFFPALALMFAMAFAFGLQLSATQTAFAADTADTAAPNTAESAKSADDNAEQQKAKSSEEPEPAKAAEPEPVKEKAAEPEPVKEETAEPETTNEAPAEPETTKEEPAETEKDAPAPTEEEKAEPATDSKDEAAIEAPAAPEQETPAQADTAAKEETTAKAAEPAKSPAATTTQPSKASTATAVKTTATAKASTSSKAAKRASKAITSVSVKNAVYTGKSLKPAVTVKSGGTTLKQGKDFKVTYKNNRTEGTGKVTITGIGSYAGTKTASFIIFGAAKYKAGASRMPISSTSKWTLKNATLAIASGKGVVSVKGHTVTGLKKGIATIAIRDKVGKTLATKAVSVYGFSGKVKIRLAGSKTLYLQANSKSKKNGANISVGNKAAKNWQNFTFKRNSDGSYSMLSSYSKKYVQVKKGSLDNNANVYQWKKLNRDRDRQHWKIKVDANNRLTFVNVTSGKALSVSSKAVNGANVVQYKDKSKTWQKWVVTGSLDEAKAATAATKTAAKAGAGATQAGIAIAAQAVKISYSKTVYQGQGTGTKYYLSVAKTLAKNNYYIKNKNQMRCNVPVAAAVRGSGVDKKFPTSLSPMYNYMKKSSKWKCLGNYSGREGALRPGDVLIRIAKVTSYKSQKAATKGQVKKAETSHACVYVGRQMAQSGYTLALQGTDADKGKPASNAVFVSGHTSKKNAAKRSAACLESARAAYGDYKMIVFRYVG